MVGVNIQLPAIPQKSHIYLFTYQLTSAIGLYFK